MHLAITAIFAVTEDMVLSRRVFRRVQKSLGRPWLAIFRPGGGRGAAWILMQMLVLLVIGFRIGHGSASSVWLLAMCGYICFFTGSSDRSFSVRMFENSIRTAYLRAVLLLFFPHRCNLGRCVPILPVAQHCLRRQRSRPITSSIPSGLSGKLGGSWKICGWHWGPFVIGVLPD